MTLPSLHTPTPAVAAVLDRIRRIGVIAVVRAPDADTAIAAGVALVTGGVTGIEITFSTPDAPRVIRELSDRLGDAALVGAGTVVTQEHARLAADAGARFLVSPGTTAELAASMKDTGLAVMTGALTPSEVMHALALRTDVVKIFPASLGGPAYLTALRGPFPDAPLMPTGGVRPDNVAEWVSAGAVALGAGGDLVPASALASGDMAEIERRARAFSSAWTKATR
ncbi:bifunctional 4-hydroxy-2-oxoglutarate aldolase/2-dehydro-3-deoxy-phosphogluconate aldolase [Labedella populi]|uniref:bifunctional 4-hydroxy-2-oxoglutarate aldolase/2-dehydro-3-deoxy-phosphogluconate aldolase n=1 Tax=Labedella populi TaxID=2498850 RepID=UPI001FB78798|nr:bifunctional 4-hydroxy-2-oxoglutarate aldolase/2-dehydro-3-deoxy-phosphogluconate aldolase [Labedella populi]